ncbi:MAG: polyphosphate polymerase domain-containing protein [Bacteroidales bacterium]
MFRSERKYLVPNYLLDPLRSRFGGFVRPDLYSDEDKKGRYQYTVRSIYFDSHDMAFYHEKLSGLMDRRKLRVRGYNQMKPGEEVVLEIKLKNGNRIFKHRAGVLYERLNEILQTGEVEPFLYHGSGQDLEKALTDAGRFLFHYKNRQLKPTCLVAYEREAYHGKHNPGVRVTFDKNIRSRLYPEIEQLFSEEHLRLLFKSHFILEVKYFEDKMPSWARSIIYEFKLRTEALSKYVIGFDVNKTFAHY